MNPPYALPQAKPLSPEQVKNRFLAHGIPVSRWAKANGYTPRYVYMVINGQFKGNFGKTHEISVKLGLKLAPQTEERLSA